MTAIVSTDQPRGRHRPLVNPCATNPERGDTPTSSALRSTTTTRTTTLTIFKMRDYLIVALRALRVIPKRARRRLRGRGPDLPSAPSPLVMATCATAIQDRQPPHLESETLFTPSRRTRWNPSKPGRRPSPSRSRRPPKPGNGPRSASRSTCRDTRAGSARRRVNNKHDLALRRRKRPLRLSRLPRHSSSSSQSRPCILCRAR